MCYIEVCKMNSGVLLRNYNKIIGGFYLIKCKNILNYRDLKKNKKIREE